VERASGGAGGCCAYARTGEWNDGFVKELFP
jgi:hypothetical protein